MLPALLLALLLPSGPAQEPLATRVDAAIEKGGAALRARRGRNGGWPEPFPNHPGGVTALALHALLHSGARAGEPEVVQALAFLRRQPHRSTYASSLRLLVEADLGPAADRAEAEKALRFLLRNRAPDGLWGYPSGSSDLSNTQFAILALGATGDLGLQIPDAVLEDVARKLQAARSRSGGFGYRAGASSSSLSMTASSLGGLAILRALGAAVPETTWEEAAARYAGLFRSLPEGRTPEGLGGYYHLYALERYGSLAGLRQIAGRDWYALGAESLLRAQEPDGAWRGGDAVATSFALLFLARASGGLAVALTPGGRGAALPGEAARGPAPAAPRLSPWLAAGPWPATRVPDPAGLRPRQDGRQGGRRWHLLDLLPDSPTPLDRLPGPWRRPGTWLLAGWLRWTPPSLDGRPATAPVPLTLWLASHASWSLYLDGQLVARSPWHPRQAYEAVDLDLPPGRHLLLLRLDRSREGGTLDLRWSDRSGRPLPSLVGWSPHPAGRGRP